MRLTLLTILLFIGPFLSSGQEKVMVQVKAFDIQLKAYPNVELSVNGRDFIQVNNKGIGFMELDESELPPKSVKIRDEVLEPESWNYSKGVLEIIIRKKNFRLLNYAVRGVDHLPIADLELTYLGATRTSQLRTDARGNFEIPLPLTENEPTHENFSVKDYAISQLYVSSRERIIYLRPLTKDLPVAEKPTADSGTIFQDFDLNNLDSIQSLTVFYAIFKNYDMRNLTGPIKQKVDIKFKQLIDQLEDSLTAPDYAFIGRISDSSFVQEDVKNLLAQAEFERSSLMQLRSSFDDKINLINEKISKGLINMDQQTRENLFRDILRLESVLRENEQRFYRNESEYKSILRSVKEKFSDMSDFENKLFESETQRIEERESFQRMLITILMISMCFLAVTVVSLYFSGKLKKQKLALEHANNEIKRINENLEVLVHDRTAKLANANREMDTFFYRASHDLRGPISSIIGLCNLASRSATAEGLEIVQRTYNTAFAMDRMLKKLKVISEINHSRLLSSFHLRAAIEEIVNGFRPFIRDSRIKVVNECPEDITIQSYRDVVDIIIINLFENSLFYVTLGRKQDPEIRISVSHRNDHITLTVFDNGVGIEPGIRDKIWEMFYIGNEHSQGHGLGLYIVRKAMEMLNGHISLETEHGSYTRITLSIPVNSVAQRVAQLQERPVVLLE